MRFLRGFGREGLVTGPRNGNGKKGGTRCGRSAIAKRRRWWTRFRLGRSLRRRGCVWARGFQFDPESETVVGVVGGGGGCEWVDEGGERVKERDGESERGLVGLGSPAHRY